VQIHPGEAECGRNQRARPASIRREGFTVLVEPRVVAARTPAREHFLYRGLVDTEKKGLEVRRERDDDADAQVAVCPAVRRLPMPGAKELSTFE
jgi:hypothetical protein